MDLRVLPVFLDYYTQLEGVNNNYKQLLTFKTVLEYELFNVIYLNSCS